MPAPRREELHEPHLPAAAGQDVGGVEVKRKGTHRSIADAQVSTQATAGAGHRVDPWVPVCTQHAQSAASDARVTTQTAAHLATSVRGPTGDWSRVPPGVPWLGPSSANKWAHAAETSGTTRTQVATVAAGHSPRRIPTPSLRSCPRSVPRRHSRPSSPSPRCRCQASSWTTFRVNTAHGGEGRSRRYGGVESPLAAASSGWGSGWLASCTRQNTATGAPRPCF